MTNLDGAVAIVTGSGRGIGLAIAQRLAARGVHVLINDIDPGVAELGAQTLTTPGASYAGDLTRPDSPAKLVAAAVDRWGRLDIVVNNAGYTLDAPIHKLTDDSFQAMLDIHTVVPFRVLRAAAPHLRDPAKAERAEGHEVFRKIVNVTSMAGTAGNPGQANYAAAKAGLVGLTKTLAKEWGPFKINVNAVAFGLIETRLTSTKTSESTITVGERVISVGVPESVKQRLAESIPLGRPGTPDEAAAPVEFLCSASSNYITGQVLNVSGGATLGMDC